MAAPPSRSAGARPTRAPVSEARGAVAEELQGEVEGSPRCRGPQGQGRDPPGGEIHPGEARLSQPR